MWLDVIFSFLFNNKTYDTEIFFSCIFSTMCTNILMNKSKIQTYNNHGSQKDNYNNTQKHTWMNSDIIVFLDRSFYKYFLV